MEIKKPLQRRLSVRTTLSVSVALVIALCAFLGLWTAHAAASPGDLDLTFGTDGTARTNFSTFPGGTPDTSDTVRAIVEQPDGKYVAAGFTEENTGVGYVPVFGVARYLADGTPDPVFGAGSGRVVVTQPEASGLVGDVVLQADGRILVAGTLWTTTARAVVVRLASDGSLDGSYGGGDGVAEVGSGMFHAVAVQPNGKVVAAGQDDADLLIARFEADGTPDPSFGGGDGVVTQDIGGRIDEANDVLIRPSGEIVTVGTSHASSFDVAGSILLSQLTPSGLPDSSFGDGDGIEVFQPSSFTTAGGGEAGSLLPAGELLVVGGSRSFTLTRFQLDGSIDRSFGPEGSGSVSPDLLEDPSPALARALAVQPDGRIVVGGTMGTRGFGMARFEPNGQLDCELGNGRGYVTTGSGLSRAEDLILVGGAADKVVLAGDAQGAINSDFALARYSMGRGVDCVHPIVSIVRHPDRFVTPSKRVTVALTFAASEPVTFVCELDDKRLPECSSPETIRVGLGKHVFTVSGVDRAGLRSEAASTRFFVLRYKKPRRGKRKCFNFWTQAGAQRFFEHHRLARVRQLDPDHDKVACEERPAPYRVSVTIGYNKSRGFFFGGTHSPSSAPRCALGEIEIYRLDRKRLIRKGRIGARARGRGVWKVPAHVRRGLFVAEIPSTTNEETDCGGGRSNRILVRAK